MTAKRKYGSPVSYRMDREVVEVINKVHELTGYPKTSFVCEAILQWAPRFCELHARKRLQVGEVMQALKINKDA